MAFKLTTVIITFNEAENIERCLKSVLPISDEVIVIDSYSRDNTVAICRKYNVKVVQRKWEGYSATKNYGSSIASNDWILSVDADEVVSPSLALAISNILKAPDYKVYKLLRVNNYCGKWIKYGGWHNEFRKRLYNRNYVRWNDNEVHEDVLVKDNLPVGTIKEPLLHYSYKTISEHRIKTEKYAAMSAREMFRKGKKPSPVKLYLSPVFKFVKDFIFRLGFIDGYYGYIIAKENAIYTNLKYTKLKELYKLGDLS
ncbi:MAG TPA: glycosyltransferase family 2 protein [Cytophagaceae bacterium]